MAYIVMAYIVMTYLLLGDSRAGIQNDRLGESFATVTLVIIPKMV